MADDLIEHHRAACKAVGVLGAEVERLKAEVDRLTREQSYVVCDGCGRGVRSRELHDGRCAECWAAEAGRLKGQRDAAAAGLVRRYAWQNNLSTDEAAVDARFFLRGQLETPSGLDGRLGSLVFPDAAGRDAVVPLPVAMRAEDISEGDVAALREAAKSTPRVVERLKATAFGDAAGRDEGGGEP